MAIFKKNSVSHSIPVATPQYELASELKTGWSSAEEKRFNIPVYNLAAHICGLAGYDIVAADPRKASQFHVDAALKLMAEKRYMAWMDDGDFFSTKQIKELRTVMEYFVNTEAAKAGRTPETNWFTPGISNNTAKNLAYFMTELYQQANANFGPRATAKARRTGTSGYHHGK